MKTIMAPKAQGSAMMLVARMVRGGRGRAAPLVVVLLLLAGCADRSKDIKLCVRYPENIQAAIDACTRLIDDPPLSDPAREGWFAARGNHKLKAGDRRGALVDFDESIRLSPTDPDLYERRARLRVELGDVRSAEADILEARRLRVEASNTGMRDARGD